MKHIKDHCQQLSESKKPTNSENMPMTTENQSTSRLTARHIQHLWLRFARIYGHKWMTNFGDSDDGTWLAGLGEVTLGQLGAGLDACMEREDSWPPSLPEFRAMCLPEVTTKHYPGWQRGQSVEEACPQAKNVTDNFALPWLDKMKKGLNS